MTRYGYVRNRYPISTIEQIKKIYELDCDDVYIEDNLLKEDKELKKMHNILKEHDQIAVYNLNVFGKRLSSLEKLVDEWEEKEIELLLFEGKKQILISKEFYECFHLLYQTEKSLGSHVASSGIEKAKEQGHFCGRPTISEEMIHHVESLYKKDYSLNEIAKLCNLSIGTVRKYVRNIKD